MEKWESQGGSPHSEVREGFLGSFEKPIGIVQAEKGAPGRGGQLEQRCGISEPTEGAGARPPGPRSMARLPGRLWLGQG